MVGKVIKRQPCCDYCFYDNLDEKGSNCIVHCIYRYDTNKHYTTCMFEFRSGKAKIRALEVINEALRTNTSVR